MEGEPEKGDPKGLVLKKPGTTPGVPAMEFVSTKWRTTPGASAMEFVSTKLRSVLGAPGLSSAARKSGVGFWGGSSGAPAFVFHPALPGWNLLRKREGFTRGPRTSECNEEVWGGSFGAPAFVFHPALPGWNPLWKREDHTRAPAQSSAVRLCGVGFWGGSFGAPAPEFAPTKLRSALGAPAPEFALKELSSTPGAPGLSSAARKSGVGLWGGFLGWVRERDEERFVLFFCGGALRGWVCPGGPVELCGQGFPAGPFARAAPAGRPGREKRDEGERAGGRRGVGANRPGVCTRVSARLFPAAACGDWPVRSECAGTLCRTPGLPSRLPDPSPLPPGSSFVICPPTRRSTIPSALPLYIVRAPRTLYLPAPQAWVPLGGETPTKKKWARSGQKELPPRRTHPQNPPQTSSLCSEARGPG